MHSFVDITSNSTPVLLESFHLYLKSVKRSHFLNCWLRSQICDQLDIPEWPIIVLFIPVHRAVSHPFILHYEPFAWSSIALSSAFRAFNCAWASRSNWALLRYSANSSMVSFSSSVISHGRASVIRINCVRISFSSEFLISMISTRCGGCADSTGSTVDSCGGNALSADGRK